MCLTLKKMIQMYIYSFRTALCYKASHSCTNNYINKFPYIWFLHQFRNLVSLWFFRWHCHLLTADWLLTYGRLLVDWLICLHGNSRRLAWTLLTLQMAKYRLKLLWLVWRLNAKRNRFFTIVWCHSVSFIFRVNKMTEYWLHGFPLV